jgi:hypothetical protein
MTKNEKKIALCKQKPMAMRNTTEVDCDIYIYACQIETENPNKSNTTIFFEVPRSEMGENIFEEKVPAQLLIRWLI